MLGLFVGELLVLLWEACLKLLLLPAINTLFTFHDFDLRFGWSIGMIVCGIIDQCSLLIWLLAITVISSSIGDSSTYHGMCILLHVVS